MSLLYDVYVGTREEEWMIELQRKKTELTRGEQRIINYFLYEIRKQIREGYLEMLPMSFPFSVRNFCQLYGLEFVQDKDCRSIRRVLTDLAGKPFWLQYKGEMVLFQWITATRINTKTQKIEIIIPEKFAHLLWEMARHYKLYQMEDMLSLRGTYSVRLYELLDHFWSNNILDFEVEVDELRSFMGIPSGKYREFKAFRRGVLERCLEEIKVCTGLYARFTPVRSGRKCVSIKFQVNKTDIARAGSSSESVDEFSEELLFLE